MVEAETGKEYSYGQLIASIQQRTSYIQKLNIQGNVSILMSKSFDKLSILLALFYSPLSYTPLDISSPRQRWIETIDASSSNLLVANKTAWLAIQKKYPKHQILLTTKDIIWVDLGIGDYSVRPYKFSLFTSGSTGKPKGVAFSQANLSAFIDWAKTSLVNTGSHRIASLAGFHFDLSTFDIFLSMKLRRSLVLFNHETIKRPKLVAQYLEKYEINIIYTTPSLLQSLIRFGQLAQKKLQLHKVILAGEQVHFSLTQNCRSFMDHVQFYNLYGLTETNVCTWHHIRDEENELVPIGKICPFADYLIKTEEQEYKKTNAKGELYISGDSVTDTYIPASDESFVEIEGERWFGTKDIVQADQNGLLSYIQRMDRMVKRRGNRIELAEIEFKFMQHPDINIAVCVYIPNQVQNLILFYQSKQQKAISHLDLSSFGNKLLPSYMMPNRFVLQNDFPLTSTQKIDYQKLKEYVG